MCDVPGSWCQVPRREAFLPAGKAGKLPGEGWGSSRAEFGQTEAEAGGAGHVLVRGGDDTGCHSSRAGW